MIFRRTFSQPIGVVAGAHGGGKNIDNAGAQGFPLEKINTDALTIREGTIRLGMVLNLISQLARIGGAVTLFLVAGSTLSHSPTGDRTWDLFVAAVELVAAALVSFSPFPPFDPRGKNARLEGGSAAPTVF